MTLEEQLIRDEGEVLHLYYDDLGVPTIGIGCNLRDVRVPQDLAAQITITPGASRALFLLRLADAKRELAAGLPWTVNLDDARRDALYNLCFNMGLGGLRAFTRMLAAMEHGDYARAAVELLDSRYATQVGARAQRLALQIRTGERQ